jgi:hypothetical protein
MPMSLLSPKLCMTHRSEKYNCGGYHAIWCPACEELHEFAVDRPFHNGHRWTFDGNVQAPTFQPSMNIRVGPYPDGSKRAGQMDVCHFFLHGGRLQYLGDCTHALKGQTVDLPDLPQSVLDKIAHSIKYAAGLE